MERSSHLNQPLQEHLFRLLRLQPGALPCLMCRKELPFLIESQAFSKWALGPIKLHLLRHQPHANIVWTDVPAGHYESSRPSRANHPATANSHSCWLVLHGFRLRPGCRGACPSRLVDSFDIAATQVSVDEYARFLDATGRTAPRFWGDLSFSHPQQPVVAVSWYDAVAYCAWLSAMTGSHYRLPTEAE